MKEQLIGYLFDALDEDEARAVEAALADQGQATGLRRDLELLRGAVAPLARDRSVLPAPAGLAARTLAFVARQVASESETVPLRPKGPLMSPAREAASPAPSRVWLDRLLLAASALAACILVVPLVYDSIIESRARRVERNLQRVSGALQGYAESHRFYPSPPDGGPLSRAGLFAPTLVSEHRLVSDDGILLVPDSELARSGVFRIPTLDEIEAAVGTPRFDELVRIMGGDFGYTLGHRSPDGRLQPNTNLRRASHPILADAPAACCEKSNNHPDGFHYILFEDGHFERRHADFLHRDAHLYRNRAGKVAAGVDPDDTAIGASHHQP
jgi:hypothetical protein